MLPCISTRLQAQKERLQLMLKDKVSFKEITSAYNDFFKTEPESFEKEKMEKHFSRWAWYASMHLGPEGKFVNINERTMQAVADKKPEAPGRSANANWTFVGPNSVSLNNPGAEILGNGRVDRMAFHPTNSNIIYVGTPSGGLWKTENGGNSWTCLSNFIPSLGISGIVVDHVNPNKLYVLTGDGDTYNETYLVVKAGYNSLSVGVMVSYDAGITWQMGGKLSSNDYAGYNLIQHPTNANILIAATSDGLYRTVDGGGSWQQVLPGKIFDVEFKPGDASRLYASGEGSFFYSSDTGESWNGDAIFNYPLCTGGRCEIAVTAAAPEKVYLLAGPKISSNTFCGFFVSTDNGINFNRLCTSPNVLGKEDGFGDQSMYDIGLAVKPNNDQIIIAGGIITYKSTNGGILFNHCTHYRETDGNYIHPDIHSVAYNPLNNYLYAAGDGGFHKSTNDGASWTDLYNGINTAQFYHLDDYDGNPNEILAGCQDNGVKFRSTNTSEFSQIYCCDGADMVIFYSNPNRGYAAINSYIFHFPDFTNFAPSFIANSGFFPNLELNSSDPVILYYSYSNIFKYNAINHTAVILGDTSIHGAWALRTCPSNSNRIYAAGGHTFYDINGDMFVSSDAGLNWECISANSGFPSTFPRISEIGVRPTNSDQVYACFSGYTDGLKILYSDNAGVSWSNISFDLPNIPVWSIEIDAANNVYLGTDIGVYYKAMGASNWEAFYNGLPSVPVSDLAINESADQILAATFGRGIWKSSLKDTCPPVYAITSDLSGPFFGSASDSINMNSKLSGGEGTYAVLRAGQNIDLKPGFRADGDPGNKFLAYIGPCDSGSPPDFMGLMPLFPWEISSYKMKMTRSEGSLEIETNELSPYNKDHKKLILRLFKYGDVRILLSDGYGRYLRDIATLKGEKDTYSFDIDTSELSTGTYFLYLVINGQVDHLQELVID